VTTAATGSATDKSQHTLRALDPTADRQEETATGTSCRAETTLCTTSPRAAAPGWPRVPRARLAASGTGGGDAVTLRRSAHTQPPARATTHLHASFFPQLSFHLVELARRLLPVHELHLVVLLCDLLLVRDALAPRSLLLHAAQQPLLVLLCLLRQVLQRQSTRNVTHAPVCACDAATATMSR
jgi:hypothetical protein